MADDQFFFESQKNAVITKFRYDCFFYHIKHAGIRYYRMSPIPQIVKEPLPEIETFNSPEVS